MEDHLMGTAVHLRTHVKPESVRNLAWVWAGCEGGQKFVIPSLVRGVLERALKVLKTGKLVI
jgi:hypothetical protein